VRYTKPTSTIIHTNHCFFDLVSLAVTIQADAIEGNRNTRRRIYTMNTSHFY
jgi:hypothetical protein